MVRPVAVDGGWRQPSEGSGEGHEGYCWYELPSGHQWQNDYLMPMNATTGVDLTDPILAALPSFVNFSAILGPKYFGDTFIAAVECALYSCVTT